MNSNLVRIAHALCCEPWLIRPETHSILRDIVSDHIAGGSREAARREAGDAIQAARIEAAPIAPTAAEKPPYDIVDGVAVIPVMGVIGYRLGLMEKSSGAVDAADIIDACMKAADDPNVLAAVLHIDSPGGSVGGVADAAAAVELLRGSGKPVVSYTDGMMASAAYWIGSAADALYAGAFASVGSVGVYLAILDQSAAYASAGLKVDLFKSGEYKGMGTPGTTLSDEQREHLQSRVDVLGAAFRGYVQSRRPKIALASMDGRDFMGEQAKQLGFVDYVGTLERAINDARTVANMRKQLPIRGRGTREEANNKPPQENK